MGFTKHFYIIFGTNLLTGGPARIIVFLPTSVFRRKGISNGIQTEWNLRERHFWNKRDLGDLEWTSRKKRGGHEAGRRACPLDAPPPSWAPRSSTDLLLPPIYTHIPRKHPGDNEKQFPSWSLRRHSTRGGIDHGGLLHQHPCLSDELWVLYHRPIVIS